MSRFFSAKYAGLVPYTPGEQPQERKYIKLNTNESPFPPSPKAQEYARREAARLQLYSDPEARDLVKTAAARLQIPEDRLLFTNGSDEILNFAFMAFCDQTRPAVFPDVTYGFYKVFARLNGVPYREIPLKDDFSVDPADYLAGGETVFLANPNAPTGRALPLDEIEKIVASDPDRVVVIDEAYVDFGGESAVGLTDRYDNLLVTQTFSKSRSLAGARLGFGIACPALIRDLNTVKYSTNPYNVNRMTMAAGIGALEDEEVFRQNCAAIVRGRETLTAGLEALGFTVCPSSANFVFARHPAVPGKTVYEKLREKGVLVRHFNAPRLTEYNRITVGDETQVQAVLAAMKQITEE